MFHELAKYYIIFKFSMLLTQFSGAYNKFNETRCGTNRSMLAERGMVESWWWEKVSNTRFQAFVFFITHCYKTKGTVI